jgi:hypothetical protein
VIQKKKTLLNTENKRIIGVLTGFVLGSLESLDVNFNNRQKSSTLDNSAMGKKTSGPMHRDESKFGIFGCKRHTSTGSG